MKTSDFYYDLPEGLIAQTPLERRDSSRLLVMDKNSGALQDRHFGDIVEYLNPGDCLVVNRTRVIPARLIGKRIGEGAQGGRIEFLLLKRLHGDVWETLAKPGRKAKIGAEFSFGEKLVAVVEGITDDGGRVVRFVYKGIWEELLDELGQMPLPPYITQTLDDKERYQTIYSKESGSAAAPTAGLHFTQDLMQRLQNKGVIVESILLHVGLGTFRPVKVGELADHKMHSEYFELSEGTADRINNARKAGGRIVCVGTTSCRTLESVADDSGNVSARSGWTDIFIYPGYKFKIMDGLITNFHLPESTLLMLVSAFSNREKILNAYSHAVNHEYRFFSFGDAMLMI